MSTLDHAIANLSNELAKLDSFASIDREAEGVTLENHNPGNGKSYQRLRAGRGNLLENGKRTMSLSQSEAKSWAARINARNQKAKLTKCRSLLEQIKVIALDIQTETRKPTTVSSNTHFAINQKTYTPPGKTAKKPKITISYICKRQGGIIHVIDGTLKHGQWKAPALCGERPSAKKGWEISELAEVSCPKCIKELKSRE